MDSFFHISFNKNLEGTWKPQLPAGTELNIKSDLSEPEIPRISIAPSIKDCFRAVYPNISKYFEIENYPYLKFQVYQPKIESSTKILNWEDLNSKRYVHDAHITKESWILSPVKMLWIAEIEIYNTNKKGNQLFYRPFNDSKREAIYHSPMEIKFDIKRSKSNISLECIPIYVKW